MRPGSVRRVAWLRLHCHADTKESYNASHRVDIGNAIRYDMWIKRTVVLHLQYGVADPSSASPRAAVATMHVRARWGGAG